MAESKETTQTQDPVWTLADRLRKSRTIAGLKQVELAEQLGLGESTVAGYETGARMPLKPVAQMWAQLCGVSFEWLAGDHYPPGRPVQPRKRLTRRSIPVNAYAVGSSWAA